MGNLACCGSNMEEHELGDFHRPQKKTFGFGNKKPTQNDEEKREKMRQAAEQRLRAVSRKSSGGKCLIYRGQLETC